MDEIMADEMSKIAIKYLNATKRKERNILFMKLTTFYMPKIQRLINNNKQYEEDILSIYYEHLAIALSKWSRNRSNFSTYFYPYLLAISRVFLAEKNGMKKDISCISLDPDIIAETFTDENNIWDKIKESKFTVKENKNKGKKNVKNK